MFTEVLTHVVVNETTANVKAEVADLVHTLVDLELTIDVMENRSDTALAGNKNGFAIIRISVDTLNHCGAHEERVAPARLFVLVVARPRFDAGNVSEWGFGPGLGEPWESRAASQELLHHSLLDRLLLGEEAF